MSAVLKKKYIKGNSYTRNVKICNMLQIERLVIENYYDFFNIFQLKIVFQLLQCIYSNSILPNVHKVWIIELFRAKNKRMRKQGGKNPWWIKCNACVLYGDTLEVIFLADQQIQSRAKIAIIVCARDLATTLKKVSFASN